MLLIEIVQNPLVAEWWSTLSQKEKSFNSIRDNCGPATIDFIEWAKPKAILHRVRGEFVADDVVAQKADFTKEMKQEFKQSGLDFNSYNDRHSWILQSKYASDWHKIPHYWAEDARGKIYDPTGHSQFILSNLAKDLKSSRYIKS